MKNLTLLFALVFLTIESHASHVMGADLSYKLIDTSNGTYKFKLTLYRDCSGIQYGGEQLKIVKTGSSNTVTMNLVSQNEEVTPICLPPDVATRPTTNCPQGPVGSNGIKGVAKWVFETTYVLGKNVGYAYVGWTTCCRNAVISTGPASNAIWVQAVINTNFQNNSTVFSTPPVPYICRQRLYTYNHGAIDSFDPGYITLNGKTVIRDSLVYQIFTPFQYEATSPTAAFNMQNTPVSLNSGLTALNFLYTTNGVTLDNQSGSVSFIPSMVQDAVMAMAIHEYRAIPNANGIGYTRQHLGYVCRDIQVTVRDFCDQIQVSGVIPDSLVNANYIKYNSVKVVDPKKKTKVSFKIVGSPTQSLKTRIHVTPDGSMVKNFNYFQSIIRGNNTDTLFGEISFDSTIGYGMEKFTIEAFYCSSIGTRHSQFYTLLIYSPNTYCISKAVNNGEGDIIGVSLKSLNNNSTCNSLSGSQGTATGIAGLYSDFTTSATIPLPQLKKSTTSNLKVNIANCSSNSKKSSTVGFIDWDQSGDFSAGEKYTLSNLITGNHLDSLTLTVPTNAIPGITRMRISCREDTASNIGPCDVSSWGETEDYDIEIVDSFPPPSCSQFKNFTYSKLNSVYYFTSTGTVSSPYSASYYWEFSNGLTSTLKDPIVTSMNTGYNWAKLKICIRDASNNLVCCDSSFKDSIMNVSCNIIATARITDSKCYNSFTGEIKIDSVIGGIAPYTYLWSNGSTTRDVSNLSAGTYSVTITDSFRCSSVYTYTVNQPSPISITLQKSGNSITAMVSGGGSSYTYLWDNGATTAAISNLNNGYYCVTVTDNYGCKRDACESISNSSSTACSQYRTMNYTHKDSLYNFTTTIPSSFNPSYFWDFGNGQTSSQANPSVIYINEGSYYVKFKFCLKDSSNNVICCDSIIKLVEYKKPIPCNINANFTYTDLSIGGSKQFTSSTSPVGTNYTYYWSFGDGTYSVAKNPTKTYSSNGNYTVRLIICRWSNYSSMNCCDSISKTINVSNVDPCNKFIPNFTWTNIGGSYQIYNTSTYTGFNYVSSTFSASNGMTYNYNNPYISFTKNGYYSVTLTMTVYDNSTGSTCTKSITKHIYVTNTVCGCLEASNTYTISNKSISFTSTSLCTDTTVNYLYRFGNGDSSTSKNPTYTYTLPGLYRTVMYLKKTIGSVICVDSFVQIIQITTSNPCRDSGFTTYSAYTCSNLISPVCGCDSMTYQNFCYAYKAGVKQYSIGPCINDTNYVKICGYVLNDMNQNCSQDTIDIPMSNVKINFNTNPPLSVYTNQNGYYSIYLPKGSYQITQSIPSSNTSSFPFYQLCPVSGISINASAGGQSYCNNNFYDTSSTCPDLSVQVGMSWNITPGFTSKKWISYQNRGATAVSGAVLKYRFLSGLTVLNSTSATYSYSGNIITWNLGTIPAYSTGFKYAKFYTPTSGISIGTTVVDSVWIEPLSGDCHPNNNSATYNDTCTSSWDPNDKSTAQARWMDTSVKTLDYHIRFQNTGTAPAHNVVVTDDIDPNLDLTTLKINGYSHPMTFELEDNRRLTFEFANIMLPDSGTDYEASQGYINYSIDRKPSTPIGVDIKNTASIYFDFNDAVVTNTTINTLYLKSSSSVQTLIDDVQITLFPNPVKESATLNVSSDKNVKVSYNLYDINGRMLASEGESKSTLKFEKELSLKSLHTGFYILNVSVNGVVKSIKIVKE